MADSEYYASRKNDVDSIRCWTHHPSDGRIRCTLPQRHQGPHLGPDDSEWGVSMATIRQPRSDNRVVELVQHLRNVKIECVPQFTDGGQFIGQRVTISGDAMPDSLPAIVADKSPQTEAEFFRNSVMAE